MTTTMTHNIQRILAAAVAITAISLPAAAEAQVNLEPGGSAPPAPAASAPAPAPSQPASATPQPTAADSGFQWGDAGIGAAGAVLVLGGGALVYAAPRRSRRGARAV